MSGNDKGQQQQQLPALGYPAAQYGGESSYNVPVALPMKTQYPPPPQQPPLPPTYYGGGTGPRPNAAQASASRCLLAALCCGCLCPSQRIDIVEWLDDTRDTIVSRFERPGNELKYGSQLVVREGQVAAFVNGGRLADVFGPGTYTLETQNLPVLSTLQGWAYGFSSPFKAEVYFVSTRQMTALKWGTANPVIVRDPELGTVRLRAFGSVAIRIADAATFLREMVGTDSRFKTDEVCEWLRSLVATNVARALASSGISVADIAGRQDLLESVIHRAIEPDLNAMGITVTRFVVENVSLPPEVEQALDKRGQINVIGNLNEYSKLQAANAMEAAANNPNGAAGGAMGMQMGWALSQQAGAQIRDGRGREVGGGGSAPSPQTS